jgi:two-component system, sensor histidine kinase and response regulator
MKEKFYPPDIDFSAEYPKHLSALLSEGPIVFISWRANEYWPVTNVTKNCKEILGYSPDEMVGTGFNYLTKIHNEDIEHYLENVTDLITYKKQFISQKYSILHKNGTYKSVLEWSVLDKGENDEVHVKGYLIDSETIENGQTIMRNAENNLLSGKDISQIFLSENITDVIFICDLDLNVTYVSPSIIKLTGETPEEHLKKRPEETHTPESLEFIRRTIHEEFERDTFPGTDKNRSGVFETQLYRADGTIIEVASNITILRDEQGNPYGFQGIMRDISEQKKNEKELKERESRVKLQRTAFAELLQKQLLNPVELHDSHQFITKLVGDTLDVDGTGIWFLSEENLFLECACYYDREKNSFTSGLKLKTVDFPNYFKALLEDGSVDAEDAIIDSRTEELNEIYLSSTGVQSLLDSCIIVNGKLYGIIGCEHKSSKRHWHPDEESFVSTAASIIAQLVLLDRNKQSEEELFKSEENLNITLNSIGDGVIATDTLACITRINPVAEKLTGWCAREAIGKKLSEVFHIVNSKTNENIKNPAQNVLEKGEICILKNHTTLISKTGEKYHISDSASPIRNAQGEISGVVLVFRDITKEYTTTQYITESERKYRELYQNLRDASAAVSLDGKIIEFNEAFRKMMGYEINEIFKLTYTDITPSKWHESEKNILDTQVLVRGYSDLYEKEYIRKDGTVFPIEITTYLTHDSLGQPIGFSAFIRDITDRKNNEKQTALNYYRSEVLLQLGQMSELTLKEITNFTLEKAVELTQSKIGYLAFVNEDETVLTMHSWSENAMKECAISDIPINYIVEETGLWGEAVRQRKAIITNDYADDNPLKKGHPEGHVQIIRHMNTPVFDMGKIVIVAGVGNKDEDYSENDVQQLTLLMQGMWRIIERNRSENELRIFQESLENSTDAIGMSSPEGIHQYQNKAFTDLFGVIGEHPPECLYVDKQVGEEVFRTILSGQNWTGEVQMYSKEKTIVDIYLRAYANKDNHGNISAVVGIHTDITAKKMAEKAILAAKEKAEESDRLKSVFLANVSHEIRTPMNAILGFLELLKGDDLTHEKMNSYIDIVNQSGKRLLNTINDIIEISKIEAGQSDVYISEVNLSEIMQFLFDFFRQLCFEKGLFLRISEQIPLEQAIVKTDRHKVDGILTNLINNAIKFTYEGTIEFGNRIEGDMLHFYVKDSGIGIPADRIHAIFERFVQADVKKTRTHEGSGLGLAIVKAYVEMLGGKVWIESEVNKGSTFNFTIPYEPVKKIIPFNFNEMKEDKPEAKDIKLLVAEDNEYNFQYLEKILIEEGMIYIRAHTGEETIQLLKENSDISLVLVDIKMPGMNGLDATRQIREFNPHIPIIAQTAYVWSGERENSIEAGCNDYILKPINRQHLMRLINKYTNR